MGQALEKIRKEDVCMQYGELKEKTEEYRQGHSKGISRMADFLISEFAREFPEKQEELKFLRSKATEYQMHCDTYGNGIKS